MTNAQIYQLFSITIYKNLTKSNIHKNIGNNLLTKILQSLFYGEK